MSNTETSKTEGAYRIRPKFSAADVNPANRPRMHIDSGIEHAIRETARSRAPTRSSEWDHRIGFAGELASAAYCGVRADWSITEDYVGDEGYDFVHEGDRIEVKTTTKEKMTDWELAVPVEKVDNADCFFLAQCSRPDELVHLIGWISRPRLKEFGTRFDGRIRVDPRSLNMFEPLELFPDQVRGAQRL